MDIIYPLCRKCGASHGIGIEEMATGKIDPIDLCYDCLWEGFPHHLKNVRSEWGGTACCFNSQGEIINCAEDLNRREREKS